MPTQNTEDPLLRLAGELRELGRRMLTTADQLSHQAAAPTPPAPAAPPAPTPRPAPTPAVVPVPTPGPWQSAEEWVQRMDDVPPPPEPAAPIWDRLGVRSIAWTGAAVTLLGAVLLLVLAIQRGWLGPVPRLLIGAAFAAVLLGAAPRVRRTSGGRVGSYALAGTGLAVCYLDVVAATALYHYVPVGVGLLLGLVVAVGGLWLADRWRSCPLAVFVVLGAAVLAPLCTGGATPLLVGFLLVLSGAASPVQLRRGWPWLTAAAGLPPVLAALYLDGTTHYGGNVTSTTALAVLTTVVCLGLATLTALRRDDKAALGLLVIAPTPTMVAAALLTRPVAAGLLAGVAALLLGAWVVRRLRPAWLPANFAAVAGGAGVAVLAQAATRAVPADHLAVALLGLAVVFALAAMWGQSKGTLLAGGLYAATGFVVALFHALPVTLLVSSPLVPPDPATLVDAVTTGLLLVLAGLMLVVALLRLDPSVPAPAWLGIGLAGLYGSTGVVLCATMLVADDRAGFVAGHVLVTVCWAVGALVLLAKGISRLPLRIAGLALVGAAVAKLFLFDLAALDGLARAAVFLGAGIALLVAGVRYAQLVSRRRAE